MPNFLTKPFYSQIGLILMTIIQMILNIAWILLYIPASKSEMKDVNNIYWYLLTCGSAPTLLPAMAILISSFRRRGRWPIRWGAVFMLAGWFVLTVAMGLTINRAEEDTRSANYYETSNSPWSNSPNGQAAQQFYQKRSNWNIAASTLGMISVIFTLYYCIVLLVLRKSLPKAICYYSSEETKTPSGFAYIQDEESQTKSNNKHDQEISCCSRRTHCCCCSVPSGLRTFLICLGYIIYFGIVGGFSILVLMAGYD